MNPEDPGNGFRHGKVLMFINEQMSKHTKGPEFYVENVSLSWEEVEEKLRLLLEDSEMTKEAQEACAWSSLALGVRFAWRQGHLQGRRVQWLHDFACLHRSAAHALASDLKKLTDQQEMERKEAAFQLQLAHTKLAEVQRERDLMRLKLLHAELRAFPVGEVPGLTTAPVTAGGATAETKTVGGDKEVTSSDRAALEPEKQVEGATATAATGQLEGNILDQFGAVEWKNYPLGLEGEGAGEEKKGEEVKDGDGEDKSMETPTCSDSVSLDHTSTTSPQPVTVQLPAPFTYSYESPFPVTPTPSPPPSILTEPQMPPYFMATDMNMSDTEGPTVYLQEPPKDSQDSGVQQQSSVALCRSGNWDCPWCKTVNFSQRESCFHCGRRMWLASPQ
ncbi:testis-expressed protein 13B [Phodopus roborovskii]|uniref:testis-expressed protein 13B n=1 Tax=Phodopus roborovskii TaxID=109678 RepID=UPI0021E3F4C3|nr:testis-expressed protein 13B [Phodopus roborovskii]